MSFKSSSVLPAAKVAIFNGRLEALNLWLPIALFALALAEIFFFGSLFGSVSKVQHTIIVNAIFFNTTHVALTFLMLLAVPQMKAWASQKRSLLFRGAILFTMVFFLFVAFNLKVDSDISLLVTLIVSFLPLQHALWQTKGLSLFYNRRIMGRYPDQLDAKRIQISEALEKYGFYLFLLSYFWVSFQKDLAGFWFYAGWGATIAGGLMILGGASIFPNAFNSNKPLFISRILAVPLGAFSLFASSSVAVAHGIEYFCVFDKVGSNAFAEKKRKMQFLTVGFLLLLLYGAVFSWLKTSEAPFDANNSAYPIWMALLQALVTSLSVLHQYLDRVIFRMRDPFTKSQIAPLLSA